MMHPKKFTTKNKGEETKGGEKRHGKKYSTYKGGRRTLLKKNLLGIIRLREKKREKRKNCQKIGKIEKKQH